MISQPRCLADMNESLIERAVKSRDPVIAEEAFREYDTEIQRSPDRIQKANLLLGKAVLYGVCLRFADARRSLDLALAQIPDDPDTQLQVEHIGASLYDQQEEWEQAYDHLTAVLCKHRERLTQPGLRFMYEDIQLRRGLDAARMRKFQEAIQLLEESLRFDLSLEDQSNVFSSLGLSYSELGQYQRAKENFLQAFKVGLTKDFEGEAHMRLAIAYANLSLFPEAKHELLLCEDKASQYGLEITKIYGWLSWVCKGLGEKAEAERYAKLSRPT